MRGLPLCGKLQRNEAPVPISEQPAEPSFTGFSLDSQNHPLRRLLTAPQAAR
jgi:hypothetical protein